MRKRPEVACSGINKRENTVEFGKLFAVNVEFKDLDFPREKDKYLSLEVVLIARNHQILQPLLYELKHKALIELTREGIAQHAIHEVFSEACSLLGEVASLNRQTKQVWLSNHLIVSYQHLILVTQEHSILDDITKEEEFTLALQALFSALRVQAKKTSVMKKTGSYGSRKTKSIQKTTYYSDKESLPKNLENVPFPKNAETGPLNLRSNKRLYELQLGE
nr:hypothetical protein [Parachlamydia sp. AcF125]